MENAKISNTNYRNPWYEESGDITCEIEHPDYGWIPFTASPDDPEEFGRKLFAEVVWSAVEIAPCPPKSPEQIAQEVRWERDARLAELDKVVSNPLHWHSYTPEQQNELAEYRQALLDVPQQEGFPHEVEWPEHPPQLI